MARAEIFRHMGCPNRLHHLGQFRLDVCGNDLDQRIGLAQQPYLGRRLAAMANHDNPPVRDLMKGREHVETPVASVLAGLAGC